MMGYGPESSHFVVELTYNYGVKKYELGNDFGGLTIKSKGIIDRVKQFKYPMKDLGDICGLVSPDGYKFFIIDQETEANSDPVKEVTLNVTNLDDSLKYWHEILNMKLLNKETKQAILTYNESQASLKLVQLDEPLNRAKAYGRIAFAVPYNLQENIGETIKKHEKTILTPLITLDTPGKATVRVIILADPDGHEICFVDDEGFSELSKVDPDSNAALDKYMKKDPFQD